MFGAAANEPVLSLLIPTSPVPGTGFTAMVRKSEVLDLNMTVDQAIQYIVSCGVVVPPQQQTRRGIWLSRARRSRGRPANPGSTAVADGVRPIGNIKE